MKTKKLATTQSRTLSDVIAPGAPGAGSGGAKKTEGKNVTVKDHTQFGVGPTQSGSLVGRSKKPSAKPHAKAAAGPVEGRSVASPVSSSGVSAAPSLGGSGGGSKNSARNELVCRHMSLVEALVHGLMRHIPPHVDRQDLISHGYIGLIEAAERFDPARGNKFETFARTRIQGSMFDWLRSLDILPRSARNKLKQIESVQSEMSKKLGRPVDDSEVAEQLGVPLSEHQHNLAKLSCRFISLEVAHSQRSGGDGAGSFIMDLKDESNRDPVDVIQATEVWENLSGAIETLPEKEKMVIAMMCMENLNLKEIGTVLDYSPSTIRQIRERAMHTIKEAMGSDAARALLG